MKSTNAYLKQKIKNSGKRLAKYYKGYRNNLPWRTRRTSYRIFLAEMLLVRTRADVVENLFESVYSAYPNIQALSNADEKSLSIVLKPLGLSKRVPFIIRAAQQIAKEHNNKIPKNIDALMAIPGIGEYTATAIATFAYKQDFVPSDVNIFRFISRLTGLKMENKTKGSSIIKMLSNNLKREYTNMPAEALLDFTRTVCKPRSPKCIEECPLNRTCNYFNETSYANHD